MAPPPPALARASAMTPATPLTQAQRNRLCEDYFAWAQTFLRRRFGPDAEEFAGEAILHAAATFDPAKGVPFVAWAIQSLDWFYRGQQRLDYQRQSRTVSLDAPLAGDPAFHRDPAAPAAAPDSALVGAEEWEAAAARLNTLHGTPRWLVLARFFGGYSHDQIAHILGYNAQHLAHVFAQLRRA
jgi:DNA-directed RNA polymerase specialized sigma24 family protein